MHSHIHAPTHTHNLAMALGHLLTQSAHPYILKYKQLVGVTVEIKG